MSLNHFFKELRVLELAGVLAGPSVGMFFAELGAKVIKVENKRSGGDVTRFWKTANENPESPISAYYASVNYKKEVVFLDLKDTEDYQILLQLIAESDVILTNFKSGDAERYGVDAEKVRAVNDRAIYVALSGFVSDEKRTAFDVILQAETGYMSMNGTEESGSLKIPLAIIDLFAGHQMKEAVLVALLNRTKSGKGASIRLSLEEAAISSLANQASNWLMAGYLPRRMGSLHPNIAPYGETFVCSDSKELVLAVGSDVQFANLCRVLGLETLIEDERFKYNKSRVSNRKELHQLLDTKVSDYQGDTLVKLLQEKQVPAALVKNIKEVFESTVAQGLVLDEASEGEGLTRRVKTVPFHVEFYE
jgi:crotonobetainyl-CoA:carnitine CoA-transferase CaiB-like acyl-CoA transferase